jgi:hypothetical protein
LLNLTNYLLRYKIIGRFIICNIIRHSSLMFLYKFNYKIQIVGKRNGPNKCFNYIIFNFHANFTNRKYHAILKNKIFQYVIKKKKKYKITL